MTALRALSYLIRIFSKYFWSKSAKDNELPKNRWNYYAEEDYKEEFDINSIDMAMVKKHFAKRFFIFFILFLIAARLDMAYDSVEFQLKMLPELIWEYYIWIIIGPILMTYPKYYIFKVSYDSLVIYWWMLLVKDNRFGDALNFINSIIDAYPEKDMFKSTKILTLLIMGNLNECREYCDEIELRHPFSRDEDKNMIKNTLYIIDYLQLKEVDPVYVPEIDSYPKMPINETYELAQFIHNSIRKVQIEPDDMVKALNESPVKFCKSVSYLVKAEYYYDLNNEDMQEHRRIRALENSPSEEVTQCIKRHLI